jgi:hypothetical protein
MATSKKNKRNHRRKRAAQDRRQRLDRGPPTPRRDYTIPEWCKKRRISRGLFYSMLRNGSAPKTLKLNKRRTISPEADAEWQTQREAATAVEAP